jgi:hypothetical protein
MPANDQTIKLVMQMLGVDDVRAAIDALQGLQNQGPATAAALGQAEVATKQVSDATREAAASTKALEAEERAALQQMKASEAAANALAAANAKVNALFDADRAADEAARMAAANREAADAAEMLAAAERHEAEMARAAAAAEREEAEALRQMAAASKQLEAANQAVAASSARVNAALDAEAAEAQQLTTALGAETNALRATDAAQDQLEASGVTVGKGMGSLQQSIIAGSYAFQDFTATSGDLGAKLNSVSNNLPGLLVGLGGLGVALSVGATAGIAIYRNWDSIAGLWETRNPFPKAANDVDGLKRELEAAKDELEKMDKAGVGNAVQLARYNELRTRTAEIEKEVAAAMERTAQIKKLFEAPTASEAEAEKGRVEALGEIRGPTARQLAQAVSGEGNAEVEARVAEGAKAKVAAENERLRAQQAELDWQTQAREVEAIDVLIAQTDERVLKQMKADKVKLEEAAQTMVVEATIEGKIGPFRQIQKAMAERPEDFRPEQVRTFAQAAPEAIKEDMAFDARMEQATAVGKRRREKEKTLGEALTAQGKSFEGPALKANAELRRERGKQASEEETALTAEARANKARIDAEVKRINAVVGSSYKQQFEQTMATNAGNAAMGRPSEDPAVLRKRLEGQMTAAMRRRGADEQSANLAAKGIGEAGTTDLARQFESKAGTVAQKNLQIAADHNRLFAAVIGQLNGVAARQGTVERQTGELLRSINPRAHHQRRKGQP